MLQKTPVYFTTPVFKNILEFCGEPLPKDVDYCCGFNCNMTRSYYRNKDGSISYRIYQRIVSCKKCKTKYPNTGYPFCRGCYKDKDCVTCGGKLGGVFYPSCWNCNTKTIEKGVCIVSSDSDSD